MSDSTQPQPTEAADDWAAALAEQRAAGNGASATALETAAQPANIFNRLTPGAAAADGGQDLDLILDIPVTLTVELGRTKIPIKHILQLAQGSVIELDAL
ncbi:MAG: FliM/FliN family flagellar motor switch protein, partial [Burkholderiaceae bacterium]|nr:FliM/FliN family flagellar motor switch protein [Burkholderiaceae bacterium]